MNRFPIGVFLCLVAVAPLFGQEPSSPSPDPFLKQLSNSDPEKRLAAQGALMTSLDPRIPDAMLSLMTDEGNTIRRQAARAIGSRWWQIPEEKRAAFLGALSRNASSSFEDEQNMVHRAQGLLTRSYEGNMFARSGDKRWVAYERYGLPCLIDTKSETEELLGWKEGDYAALISSWGNGPTSESILWHSKRPIAAFTMLLSRKASTLWFWKHGSPLRKLDIDELLKLVDQAGAAIEPSGGYFVDDVVWKGDELRFTFSYTTVKGDEYTDRNCVLGWDSTKDKLRLIERKKSTN
jgi:hypothetical protein